VGVLVDVDPKKGTMTVECEGDFFICLMNFDSDAEIGDTVEVNMEDVLT
jgi:hypothetical protein